MLGDTSCVYSPWQARDPWPFLLMQLILIVKGPVYSASDFFLRQNSNSASLFWKTEAELRNFLFCLSFLEKLRQNGPKMTNFLILPQFFEKVRQNMNSASDFRKLRHNSNSASVFVKLQINGWIKWGRIWIMPQFSSQIHQFMIMSNHSAK